MLQAIIPLTTSSAFGQERTTKVISLKLENATVLQALEEINRLSQNNVIFKREEVTREPKRITVDLKDVTVLQAVQECIKGTRLTCTERYGRVAVGPDTEVKSVRISGTVKDQKGAILPGVTVIVKGLAMGTSTDNNGHYSLNLPRVDNLSLLFSFIGMETEEVKYAGKDTINVVMKEVVSELEEVVVNTGYQRIDARKNASAITSIRAEDIITPGLQTIDQMLEGHVPGMIFMQNSGQIGAAPRLRIRGTSTILGSQEPLWVIDGVIQEDPVNVDPENLNDLDFVNLLGNAISGLNPEDIEQIDVLKDAAATAIYGKKAANGVIVITTKAGKQGPPSVMYSVSGSFTQRPRYSDRSVNVMNSKERVAFSRDMIENRLAYPKITSWVGYEAAYRDYIEGQIGYSEYKSLVDKYETMNTDWFDILMQDAFSHKHTLSLSGGSS
ncbi:carboxypeptidase-like regulatory domain-containing protein, partial [Butyricimonas virosa]